MACHEEHCRSSQEDESCYGQEPWVANSVHHANPKTSPYIYIFQFTVSPDSRLTIFLNFDIELNWKSYFITVSITYLHCNECISIYTYTSSLVYQSSSIDILKGNLYTWNILRHWSQHPWPQHPWHFPTSGLRSWAPWKPRASNWPARMEVTNGHRICQTVLCWHHILIFWLLYWAIFVSYQVGLT